MVQIHSGLGGWVELIKKVPSPEALVRGASIVRCGHSCLVDLNLDLCRLCGSLYGPDTFWPGGLSWIKKRQQQQQHSSRSLFVWNFENRLKMVVSWFRLGFCFAFRWPFQVSSSTERAVPRLDWFYLPIFCTNASSSSLLSTLKNSDKRRSRGSTRVPGLGQITWWIVMTKKLRGHSGEKIAQKSRNSCCFNGGGVGAHGQLTRGSNGLSPRTKYQRSNNTFGVTCIESIVVRLCSELL